MKSIVAAMPIAVGVVAAWQTVALSQSGTALQIAFDIPKVDISAAPPAGRGGRGN